MVENAADRIWQTTLGQLELQVTRPNFETWLKDTVGLSMTENTLTVGTPNDYTTTWLSTRLLPLIAKTVAGIAGRQLSVSFELHGAHTVAECVDDAEASLFGGPHTATASVVTSPSPRVRLKEKFTFDRFVVSDSNRLAYASCLGLADNPQDNYNPLFIYGHVGLGKTHLLHAIGHRLHGRDARFAYTSSEHFTNEFVTAIAQGRTDEFRRRYRQIDLLLIDDIQFLGGKERTQEEFFYTFNDLEHAGARVVITSDRPPDQVPGLARRLRSRFQGGLVVDVQPPDRETRLAILQAKSADLKTAIDPEVFDCLADRSTDNVRDLEGSLNRVAAYAQLVKSPSVTLEVANQALSAFSPRVSPSTPQPPHVINTVARFFGLSPDALAGKSRAKTIADARHIAVYILREDCHLHLKEIAAYFGNRDHTSILHAHRKITTLLRTEIQLQQQVDQLRAQLSQ